jgi:hypothetical protein
VGLCKNSHVSYLPQCQAFGIPVGWGKKRYLHHQEQRIRSGKPRVRPRSNVLRNKHGPKYILPQPIVPGRPPDAICKPPLNPPPKAPAAVPGLEYDPYPCMALRNVSLSLTLLVSGTAPRFVQLPQLLSLLLCCWDAAGSSEAIFWFLFGSVNIFSCHLALFARAHSGD